MSGLTRCGLLKACVGQLAFYLPAVLTEIIITYWTLEDRITTYCLSIDVKEKPDPEAWINVLSYWDRYTAVALSNAIVDWMHDRDTPLKYQEALQRATHTVMYDNDTLSNDTIAILILLGYYTKRPIHAPMGSNFTFMLYARYHQNSGDVLNTCLIQLVTNDLYLSIAYLLEHVQPNLEWILKLSKCYPDEDHEDYPVVLAQLSNINVNVDQLNTPSANPDLTLYQDLYYRTPRLAQLFSHLPGLIPAED